MTGCLAVDLLRVVEERRVELVPLFLAVEERDEREAVEPERDRLELLRVLLLLVVRREGVLATILSSL